MRDIVDRPREPRTSRYYWEREHEPGEKFIPYFWQEFSSQVMILFLLLGIMGGLALLWPNGLGSPANPLETPANTKPEWYYLSLFQLLKIVPEEIGIIVPTVIVIAMIALPFVDRSRERNPLHKPVTTTIAVVLIIATVALTIWGWVAS
jgi:quinol-cytochrome oxidoreductase complex cytochrome b subunit